MKAKLQQMEMKMVQGKQAIGHKKDVFLGRQQKEVKNLRHLKDPTCFTNQKSKLHHFWSSR